MDYRSAKYVFGLALGIYLYQAFLRSIVASFATQIGFPLSST